MSFIDMPVLMLAIDMLCLLICLPPCLHATMSFHIPTTMSTNMTSMLVKTMPIDMSAITTSDMTDQ